jgi:hypothetical protein
MGRSGRLLSTLVVITAINLVCTWTLALADGPGFRITDYIPQKFTDLRWQISGSTSSNHESRSTLDRFDNSDHSAYSTSGHSGYEYLQFSSDLEYRYETVPFSLRCGGRSNVGFNYSHNKSRSEMSSTHAYRLSDNDSRSTGYSIGFSPFLSLEKFVSRDVFVSTELATSGTYGYNPGDRSETFYQAEPDAEDTGTVISHLSRGNNRYSYHNISVSIDATTSGGWGHLYEGWYELRSTL